MNGLIVLLYGLYLVVVGFAGNGPQLMANLEKDFPHYLPWLIAIMVLGALYQSEALEGLISAFILLALGTVVVKRFPVLKSQTVEIWNHYVNGAAW